MYRALTWLAMQRGLDLGDAEGLAQLAREQPVLFSDDDRVWIGGTDVTSSIRETRVDRMVPVVARHPAVREVMRERQRELGRDGDVVIEGRDIGTVVAPDAEVKVYPRRRPRRAREAAGRRAAGHRRRRARHRPPPPRRERRGAHAAGSRRDRDRHDEPRGRRRRRPDRGARPRALRSVNAHDVSWAIGRPVLGGSAALATRLRSYGTERIPRSGGARHRVQPLQLDRHPVRRLGLQAQPLLPRQGRGAPRSGARRVHPHVRDAVGAARRVGPRGRPADARGRARRRTRSASSSRGRGSAAACPGTCSPARRWSRCRRTCR